MPMPANCTARAVGLRRVPWHVAQAVSGPTPAESAFMELALAAYRSTNAAGRKALRAQLQLQNKGRAPRIAMVGDGINDAPVLALADLSFTLGEAAALARSRAGRAVLILCDRGRPAGSGCFMRV